MHEETPQQSPPLFLLLHRRTRPNHTKPPSVSANTSTVAFISPPFALPNPTPATVQKYQQKHTPTYTLYRECIHTSRRPIDLTLYYDLAIPIAAPIPGIQK